MEIDSNNLHEYKLPINQWPIHVSFNNIYKFFRANILIHISDIFAEKYMLRLQHRSTNTGSNKHKIAIKVFFILLMSDHIWNEIQVFKLGTYVILWYLYTNIWIKKTKRNETKQNKKEKQKTKQNKNKKTKLTNILPGCSVSTTF